MAIDSNNPATVNNPGSDRAILASTFAASTKRIRLLDRLIGAAYRTRSSNPRTRGVMTSPPTVTDDGASLPAGQSSPFLVTTYPTGLFQTIGSRITSLNRFKTSVVGATGGNSGLNDGSQCSLSKVRFEAEANKVTLRLEGSTLPFRVQVDGQYVDLTGITPGASSGTRYISLDFTSAGGRARREFVVELQAAQAFNGVYVGPTERVKAAGAPLAKTATIWDSWGYGTAATHLGDGIDAVMADWLGWDSHMNSGGPGTGWGTVTGYNFLQRLQNGDAALNGAPEVVKLAGSINDKNTAAATVTANLLAGLQLLRTAYPDLLLIVFGTWPVSGGSGGSLTVAQNEAAVLAAVTAFADPFTIYIPVNLAIGGAPIAGTGFVGSTTGTGNADFDMFDASHLNTVGCSIMGKWEADQVLSGMLTLRDTLAA